ncbi:unnamed protein product (macronuclear) [Paramecium tetraurelia]|uniref:Protein kinase domain-containing protein n=1 Tax=Paramecium tetraurelia TaxID=5888 RepID=A0CA72_PARTE|nr:uncharacterized protein GSPATT00036469001 [Paramecium tetraurelia]CAK67689.1 unnamed protein product [Paramecium tetraurelia]|eukprot:XP_001435086.1 hypothetical protein (macronuclear) [Paramecium tetraurelia strain d4-2]
MSQQVQWPVYLENDVCDKFWNRGECVLDGEILITQQLSKTDRKNQVIKERTYILTGGGMLCYQKNNNIRWLLLNYQMSAKLIDLKIQNKDQDLVKVIRVKRNQQVYSYFWNADLQKFKNDSSVSKLSPSSNDQQHFAFAKILNQLYTIQDLMGKGGYSKVYKLCPLNKQSFQNQYYAGKVYNKNELAQKKNLSCLAQLVKAECEILKQVNSPFILTLYEIIQLDEQLILITELLRSGSLYKLLKEKVRIQECEASAIIHRVALGLQAIHSLGYVHRDIKLENILIDKDQIKIIDFGFAEQINREFLTSGQGTIGYMAPEIFTHTPYTEVGDVFSLGVVYYLLLTGKPPFKGLNQENVIRANKKCEIDFSEYCFVNVSQKTIQLVKGMLQKNPKQRSSLNEVLQNLKSQNLLSDMVYRSISVEGSQLTKQGGMRSLYLQSQCSQESPRMQHKQSNLLNITQTLEKFAVKASSFRPSLQNIENYSFDSDDLEDNSLPHFVLEFLQISNLILNQSKLP